MGDHVTNSRLSTVSVKQIKCCAGLPEILLVELERRSLYHEFIGAPNLHEDVGRFCNINCPTKNSLHKCKVGMECMRESIL